MAKRVVEGFVSDLKKLVTAEKLVLGSERTLKLLRDKKLERVYVSSDCNPETSDQLHYLAGVMEVPVEVVSKTADEIGVICRKPFAVSVVGVLA